MKNDKQIAFTELSFQPFSEKNCRPWQLLRATAVPEVLLRLRARISHGNSVRLSVRPSVCLSVCHGPVPIQGQVG